MDIDEFMIRKNYFCNLCLLHQPEISHAAAWVQ